jgi:hypothetical protein
MSTVGTVYQSSEFFIAYAKHGRPLGFREEKTKWERLAGLKAHESGDTISAKFLKWTVKDQSLVIGDDELRQRYSKSK